MSRLPFCLVVSLLVFALGEHAAGAHELDSNTARVSLRDGNLTIHLRADAASLRGPEDLLAGLRVRLDGNEVPLQVRSFPSQQQLVEVAAANAIEADLGGHAHARLLPVALESASSGWTGDALELSFPRELGPVLVTFVQPKTRQGGVGATIRFDVLRKVSPTSAEKEAKTPWSLPLLGLAFGIGGVWAHRRRGQAHEGASGRRRGGTVMRSLRRQGRPRSRIAEVPKR